MIEVVAAMIWNRAHDEVLICQRAAHKARGSMWEFVGGKVESGETKEAALVRECREELGITLAVEDAVIDVTHRYPDITVHLTLFDTTIAEGVPQLLEHQAMKWVSPQAFADYDFCPADAEMIRRLIAQGFPNKKCTP